MVVCWSVTLRQRYTKQSVCRSVLHSIQRKRENVVQHRYSTAAPNYVLLVPGGALPQRSPLSGFRNLQVPSHYSEFHLGIDQFTKPHFVDVRDVTQR